MEIIYNRTYFFLLHTLKSVGGIFLYLIDEACLLIDRSDRCQDFNQDVLWLPQLSHMPIGLETKIYKDNLIILAAFGDGFTWGATFVKWEY